MTAKTPQRLVEQARRLRLDRRMSLREITAETGVAVGTLSGLLRDIPLTAEEVLARRKANAGKGRARLSEIAHQRRGAESPFYGVFRERALSTDQRGAVAEAAAAFRMKVWGLTPHMPMSAGGTSDIAVFVPDTGRLLRVQVKCARRGKWGQPVAGLKARKGNGRERYAPGAFDFFVGYDAREDVCYVYAASEIEDRKSTKSMGADAIERWDKLLMSRSSDG